MTTALDQPLKRNTPLFWLTLLAPAAIIVLGVNFLVNPGGASAGFGIAIHDPAAFPYMWTKGIRDIFSGLAVTAMLFNGNRRSVAIVYATAVIIPIGDGLIILKELGVAPFLFMHWGTALYMAVVATFLFRGKKPSPDRTTIVLVGCGSFATAET